MHNSPVEADLAMGVTDGTREEKTDGQGNEVRNSDSPHLKSMIFKSESFPTFPTLYKAH